MLVVGRGQDEGVDRLRKCLQSFEFCFDRHVADEAPHRVCAGGDRLPTEIANYLRWISPSGSHRKADRRPQHPERDRTVNAAFSGWALCKPFSRAGYQLRVGVRSADHCHCLDPIGIVRRPQSGQQSADRVSDENRPTTWCEAIDDGIEIGQVEATIETQRGFVGTAKTGEVRRDQVRLR